MNSVFYYDSILGKLRIADNGKAVTQIVLDSLNYPIAKDCIEQESPLIKTAMQELNEYFDGKRKDFDLPIDPQGTEFQKKDWAELRKIPYGETRTYKQIAEAIGCPKGFRAVGLANHKNPIIIVIPCHRVIGANGALVGYAGGLHLKERLLEIEGIL